MNPILVVGSANFDLVYQVEQFPVHGETLLSKQFSTHPGGKGANQAVAIGRLGFACEFCGCVGTDGFGDVLVASLSQAGVGLSALRRTEAATGNAAIFVSSDGKNQIVVAPEANSEVSRIQVQEAVQTLQPSFVLAQLEIPLEAVEAASLGTKFVLNPAPATLIGDSILRNCYAITPNESEAKSLTGFDTDSEDGFKRAADRLLEKGVENVVITLGSRGCFWKSGSRELWLSPPKVNAIDTTAAGDAFNGGLVAYLAQGLPFEEALRYAILVGSLSTTKRGAQSSMPSREEVEALRSQS